MRPILNISVKESIAELKRLQKHHPGKFKQLQMLLVLKKRGPVNKTELALLSGSGTSAVQRWRWQYIKSGVMSLLQENRGGQKPAAVTSQVHERLAMRLNNPKEGFRSFIEIQQWLLLEFSIDMEYHAVNKYVKRKFGARLKVSRKSHVLKSPAAEAVFKKPFSKI